MGINEVQPIIEDMKKEERRRVADRILEMQRKQEKSYLKRINEDDDKRIDEVLNEFLDQNEIHISELKVLEKFIDFYKSK